MAGAIFTSLAASSDAILFHTPIDPLKSCRYAPPSGVGAVICDPNWRDLQKTLADLP